MAEVSANKQESIASLAFKIWEDISLYGGYDDMFMRENGIRIEFLSHEVVFELSGPE